eukprot:481971-Rhodomonas_salina.1
MGHPRQGPSTGKVHGHHRPNIVGNMSHVREMVPMGRAKRKPPPTRRHHPCPAGRCPTGVA